MFVGIGVGIGRNRFAQGIFNAYNLRVVADGGITEAGNCVNAVSSLLQSASLLLIPSGYKGGKLYSEIPTNGNGDLTWTRGSDAFRTNASGVIERVPWNLLQRSEEFDNAIWIKSSVTVTSNQATSPDGNLTADLLTPTGSDCVIRQSITPSSVSAYTFSVWLRSATGSDISTTIRVWRDSPFQNITNTAITVTSTWQRFTLNFTPIDLTSHAVVIGGSSTLSSGENLFAYGAQLVEGTTAQTYLPTTDRLNFPRLSYMYGSCPSALLEPQRTNVVLWSSDLSQSVWSKTNYTLSSASAIQGLTATRITKNATNNGAWNGTGARDVINTVGTFASGTKAFSVLLRKGNTAKVGLLINGILVGASVAVSCEFDFSTETFTNVSSGLTATFEKPTTDVYRLILVCNDIGVGTSKQLWIAPIDSSNNTVTDGYVDVAYFQWELGAYATTIIPTTSATATRVADSFSRSNIYTNGLITSSGGTWFVEFRNNLAYTRDNGQIHIALGDTSGGADNSLAIRNLGGGSVRLSIQKYIATANTTLFTTTTDTVKIAIKWNGSTADVFVNGVKQVSATAFTTVALQNLITGIQVPTFIQQMALFPTPLSDTDCTTITSI